MINRQGLQGCVTVLECNRIGVYSKRCRIGRIGFDITDCTCGGCNVIAPLDEMITRLGRSRQRSRRAVVICAAAGHRSH